MMMMTMGEGAYHSPGIHAPPWSAEPESIGYGPVSGVAAGAGGGDCLSYLLGEAALQRYLPSNEAAFDDDEVPVDTYSCDEFRMYEFKVRRCARGRSHDWTECPYAHLGEKARRRDPRKYHYSGAACPDFRKGSCKRGDACEFAHGVFECWLHPTRYRTQPCKDGTACRRRICFFAHTPEQLRVLQTQQQHSPRVAAESYDGSPLRRHALEEYFPKSLLSSSPTSTLISPPVSPSSESPPVSPSCVTRRLSWPPPGSAMGEVLASLRQLQISKAKSMQSTSWGLNIAAAGGGGGGLFSSPGATGYGPGVCSVPTTPSWLGGGGGWRDGGVKEEEPVVERVESGRAVRAKMFERLYSLQRPETAGGGGAPAPDVDWVSELVM